jgi:hypothetical protein
MGIPKEGGKPLNIDPRTLQAAPEQGRFPGVSKPEPKTGGQHADPEQGSPPAERQPNHESNIMFPTFLDRTGRHHAAEWIQPKKEVLHGWDNFAELAFDVANFLPKPDNAAIPPSDVFAQDFEDMIGKHDPADVYEGAVVEMLEDSGLQFKIPQFRKDMEEYRAKVKEIVAAWRESGLL